MGWMLTVLWMLPQADKGAECHSVCTTAAMPGVCGSAADAGAQEPPCQGDMGTLVAPIPLLRAGTLRCPTSLTKVRGGKVGNG